MRALFSQIFYPFVASPLRTFLAVLGIVFGVAAVVAMLAIGEGAQRDIMKTIGSMGATLVRITANKATGEEISAVINQSRGLSLQDRDDIANAAPELPHSRFVYASSVPLLDADEGLDAKAVSAYGVDLNFMRVMKLDLLAGRPLMQGDFVDKRSVVVLAYAVAKRMLPKDPATAVGRVLKLNHTYWDVVGVLRDRSAQAVPTAVDGQSPKAKHDADLGTNEFPSALFMPFDSAINKLAPLRTYNPLDLLVVDVGSVEKTLLYKQIFSNVLARNRAGVEDYRITAPEELLKQQQKTQSIFNIVLLSIAAISLLVGGIGIMNIMLANVLERIKEIGIKRSLGATKRIILQQFLFESVGICIAGGLLGLALGVGISQAIGVFTSIPVAFSAVTMLLAFGISLVVGVVFGILPARKAAGVNPVQALHGE